MFNKKDKAPLWMFLFANNAYDDRKIDEIIEENGEAEFKINGKSVKVKDNGDIEVIPTNSTE